MTRDEMSKIIEQALRTYCGPLPDYIANTIAKAQPHPDHDDNPVILALRKEIRQHLDAIERLTANRCEMKRKLEDAESRLKELTGVADEFDKENQTLRNDRDVAMRKLQEAKAAQPHFYNPSTQHMGDCSICGSGQFAPQHDVAQWKARAEKAEMSLQDAHQMHDRERDRRRDADTEAEHLRDKLDKAEAIIDATKKALLP